MKLDLDLIVENAREGILVVNDQREIGLINSAAKVLVGDGRLVLNAFSQWPDESAFARDISIIRDGNLPRVVEAVAIPTFSMEGPHHLVFLRDVTEERAQHQESERRRQREAVNTALARARREPREGGFSLPPFAFSEELLNKLELIAHRSQEENAPYSVLIAVARNWPSVLLQCSVRDIEWARDDVLQSAGRLTGGDDAVWPIEDPLAVCLFLNKKDVVDVEDVISRFKLLTKDCFCPGRSGRIFLNFAVGIATSAPGENISPVKLAKTAWEDLR